MMSPVWVKSAEEEQFVLHLRKWYVATEFKVTFVGCVRRISAKLVHHTEIIRICLHRLLPLATVKAARDSVEFRASRLRHNLHDTPARMSVLRLKSRSLYLYFLHKRQVDARTQRAIRTRPYTESTECGVVDRHTVCDIRVFQPRRAGNRRIV